MAEFQEVMNHWKRMCSTHDKCVQCPLKHCISPSQSNWTMSFDAERIIMDWAAENPEPVYPLWFEWLEKIGVAGRAYDLEPYFMGDKEILLRTAAFTAKAFEPIPADIAEKLGLEPKGES